MPSFETADAGQAPSRPRGPKVVGKNLGLQILVREGEDLGALVTKASELGEVKSINVHDAIEYDDGYDPLY